MHFMPGTALKPTPSMILGDLARVVSYRVVLTVSCRHDSCFVDPHPAKVTARVTLPLGPDPREAATAYRDVGRRRRRRMSEKIHVIAHIHAAAGNEAIVREALESFVEPTRKEACPGQPERMQSE